MSWMQIKKCESISHLAAAMSCPDCSNALARMAAISSLYMICKGRDLGPFSLVAHPLQT